MTGGRDTRAGFTEYAAARRAQLHRLAYARCSDWHAADDLVQQALAKAYVVWPRIEKRGAEAPAYAALCCD